MSGYMVPLMGIVAFVLVIGVGIVLGIRATILPKRSSHQPVHDDSVRHPNEWCTLNEWPNECGE